MEPFEDWPNAGRVVWLTGGVVAYSNPGPHVDICLGSGGPVIEKYALNSYGHLFETLRKRGHAILGTTFVVHQDEVEGVRPPEFRMAGKSPGWALWDAMQKWRQIAHHAGQANQMTLVDLSSRVAFGLEYSQLRLHDLALNYALQLRACSARNEASVYQRFKDPWGREVYKAIHALFWELAVLRDTLAEFVAVICFRKSGVRTLSGLLKILKKTPSSDPVAVELANVGDEALGGWLFRFSSYRNFFTHIAPMEWSAGVSWTVLDFRELIGGATVPQIYYPLPRNINELTRERSGGNFYPNMTTFLEASRAKPVRASDPDALEYLHSCLVKFADLAAVLVERSPIPPALIHFTDKDIIGKIRWLPGTPS